MEFFYWWKIPGRPVSVIRGRIVTFLQFFFFLTNWLWVTTCFRRVLHPATPNTAVGKPWTSPSSLCKRQVHCGEASSKPQYVVSRRWNGFSRFRRMFAPFSTPNTITVGKPWATSRMRTNHSTKEHALGYVDVTYICGHTIATHRPIRQASTLEARSMESSEKNRF